jgi:Protein of unknown function (DUF3891)
MLARHPRGAVAVGQPAHAWLCGQMARAWGNERFGALPSPAEVVLAAEQHDVGMAAWDAAPTLDRETGLPTSFMNMDLETHLQLWSQGPSQVLSQNRYAALLTSMHGRRLYSRRAGEDERIDAFLRERRAFEGRVRASLPVSDDEVSRASRLVWAWDTMSLAVILDWSPIAVDDVPAAGPEGLDMRLAPGGERVVTVAPWPFAGDSVELSLDGRLLEGRYGDEAALHEALEAAEWVQLRWELRPGPTA